jgi:hypothetical protein
MRGCEPHAAQAENDLQRQRRDPDAGQHQGQRRNLGDRDPAEQE